MAPPLAALALQFQSPEYFSLMVLGLLASGVSARPARQGTRMLCSGCCWAFRHRRHLGTARFAFGFPSLPTASTSSSSPWASSASPGVVGNLENERPPPVYVERIGGLMPTREDSKRVVAPFCAAGAGFAPRHSAGGGALLASFAAYSWRRRSESVRRVGEGAIGRGGAGIGPQRRHADILHPDAPLGIPLSPVITLMIGTMVLGHPARTVDGRAAEAVRGVMASMWSATCSCWC